MVIQRIASRAIVQKLSQQVILKPRNKVDSCRHYIIKPNSKYSGRTINRSQFCAQAFSEQIGLSRMHLHRKLKALTGLSTSEFIRTQRLKLAAKLLKDGDANISEIGYTVGFNQHILFCFQTTFWLHAI